MLKIIAIFKLHFTKYFIFISFTYFSYFSFLFKDPEGENAKNGKKLKKEKVKKEKTTPITNEPKQKNFNCNVCGRAFSTRFEVKYHYRSVKKILFFKVNKKSKI